MKTKIKDKLIAELTKESLRVSQCEDEDVAKHLYTMNRMLDMFKIVAEG